jgi:hypothetical protein
MHTRWVKGAATVYNTRRTHLQPVAVQSYSHLLVLVMTLYTHLSQLTRLRQKATTLTGAHCVWQRDDAIDVVEIVEQSFGIVPCAQWGVAYMTL